MWLACGPACAGVPEASIVKLRVVSTDGEVRHGSAVVIGPETLATACHVTRRASAIEITHDGRHWGAGKQVGSALHDLCVLAVKGLDLPGVRVRAAGDLARGERVYAAGFERGGAKLVVASGTVKSLYPYDDGMVIRTSAEFEFGSSGGGLFDESGNLVGLLAFKARAGNDLRFALPSEWLAAGSIVEAKLAPIDSAVAATAFWERHAGDRPAFLGVALREARDSAQ